MNRQDLSYGVWDIDQSNFPRNDGINKQFEFLLRFVILAPSTHNTQPWKFVIKNGGVEIRPDDSRWMHNVDKNKRGLYISLGCALENLVVAAKYYGFSTDIEYKKYNGGIKIRVGLHNSGNPSFSKSVFNAITERHTSRDLRRQPIKESHKTVLTNLNAEFDAELLLFERHKTQFLQDLHQTAEKSLMKDDNYRAELAKWVRVGTLGDSRLLSFIKRLNLLYINPGKKWARDHSLQIKNSPLVGLIATDEDKDISKVESGRLFERLALASTPLGICTHPMSQILRDSNSRGKLFNTIGLFPQHLFRIGYCSGGNTTPRLPLDMVLKNSN